MWQTLQAIVLMRMWTEHISKESSQTPSTERKQAKKVFKMLFYQLEKFKDRCWGRCMPLRRWPRNVKFHSRFHLNALICSFISLTGLLSVTENSPEHLRKVKLGNAITLTEFPWCLYLCLGQWRVTWRRRMHFAPVASNFSVLFVAWK